MRSRAAVLALIMVATAPGALAPGRASPAPSRDSSEDDAALGGPATVHDSGLDAFAFPASFLDRLGRRAFAVGNAFFKENWVAAPSSVEGRDGLGPLFVARSCSTCHLRDGRGRPPRAEEPDASGILFRVGVSGAAGEAPHPIYGEQIQDRALPGIEAEARVRIDTKPIEGRYGDGAVYVLEQPIYVIESAAYGPLGDDVLVSPRVAPQLIGLGLLESIPAAAIEARADPDDRDRDGISGRANRVMSLRSGRLELGRFGWKANQPTIEQQVAKAFQQDLGITSTLLPEEPLTAGQAPAVKYVSGGSPELDDHKLERIAFYCRVLAVPARRDLDQPAVLRGKVLFGTLGCASCHVPSQRAGDYPAVPGLSNARFRPYTDLLLHDMGPDLADGKRDGEAGAAEWRTPPLWGIGLFATVNGHTRYLHDGRARSLIEAVLWHNGEALPSRTAFERLPVADREALIAFLNTL
jgi:CxxC motif-containing protein (DUF1111 family)